MGETVTDLQILGCELHQKSKMRLAAGLRLDPVGSYGAPPYLSPERGIRSKKLGIGKKREGVGRDKKG